MKKKLLFIYNAKSGKARIKNYLADIIDIFVKDGYRVETYPTQCAGDAKRKVKELGKKFGLIVCSGGDGTLNEVISGVMDIDKSPVIGYIPSGSTNDFATSIKLPKDILNSAKVAIKGTPMSVDVGSFNNKNFIYIAAFGVFTAVSYQTSQSLKNALGHTAYLIEGVKTITDFNKSYHMKIRFNGKEIEDDFIFGMITNANSVGGFQNITGNNIDLCDGLFEVTLIKAVKNAVELESVLEALVNTKKKSDSVYRFKASSLAISSPEDVAWVLDGESGGSHRRIKIVNHKKAVNIMSGIRRTKN